MNKNEYLKKLDILLESLPYDERRDIMYDYEEHFKSGLSDGKTEEEISNELGNPETIAAGYIPNLHTSEKNNYSTDTTRTTINRTGRKYSIGILIGMIFFNLIMIGLYLACWAVLASFFIVGIALVLSSVVVLIACVFQSPMMYIAIPYDIITHPFLGFLLFIFLASAGGLIIIGTLMLMKLYASFTTKYIEWNKLIVRRDSYEKA
ncbi:DUF1700 domain-containing protein [Vallitalea sp.]|uniref:DUF1700 domain-containing protein n=1 Tax=Vallitalea sp. TaxID=1882829 RepID=UPI0025D42BE7|nr:DUF1700 domain-containing protein [Vallitalea sp.]MCT4685743.1 DUF1700 domain-containing protein [Vallitalea sp.]